MADGNILSDFGIDLLEEEIDDVIFQTNEFLTDATFTGSQGPFWWILQMCMALAALYRHGGRHGVQNDGQARAFGRDEALQTAGRVAHSLLVVSSGRHGHGKQREQLVLFRFPLLYPELRRFVHT